MYDYLIVGAGLFGAVFAHEAKKHGKSCLVVEKRNHIAGNIYCKNVDGIHVHQYGAHIFHTSDRKIWDYINQFSEFNNYINSPVAIYKDELYNLPFNMNTFSKMWNIQTPAQAKAIHSSSAKKPQWTHRAILSMIENIKYTGVMANHMRESRFIRDKNQRRVPKEEWYIRKNAHEAIVTQEEFDKANEAIQRRRKTARVTHDQSDRVYYCAHCGGKLEKANGTVFACPSHRYHDGSSCEGVYWRKSALEEVLLEALKGQIEITRIESSEVKKAARIRNESLQRQLVLLKAQYDACGREKFTLYEQYREAKIIAEEYLSGKDELTRKQAALKEQLEESEALYEANQQMGDAASEQQEAVGKMTGLSDAKLREHLYDAVERVLVYDSESIEIIWKFNEVKNGSSSYAGAGV